MSSYMMRYNGFERRLYEKYVEDVFSHMKNTNIIMQVRRLINYSSFRVVFNFSNSALHIWNVFWFYWLCPMIFKVTTFFYTLKTAKNINSKY